MGVGRKLCFGLNCLLEHVLDANMFGECMLGDPASKHHMCIPATPKGICFGLAQILSDLPTVGCDVTSTIWENHLIVVEENKMGFL